VSEQPTKTEAVARFLSAKTHDDLADLYDSNMECQVNVCQDGGERSEGEFHGKQWQGWTDGFTTWKPFRIPYKANSEPEFNDTVIKFDLAEHAEAIGMTGWDWYNQCSRWVAFDFDAILGHSDRHSSKLTQDDLLQVREAALSLPWVTARQSTSGKGLHLYVFLDEVDTANHTEHAAVARSILGYMSALTGFDFKSKVDICGGNMWVWHRKMAGTEGLTLLKQGEMLKEIPSNWRDHIKVIKGTRRKNMPSIVESVSDEFEELTSQNSRIDLDEDHKALIDFLKDTNCQWWWDQDHHMLVTHTLHLAAAHSELDLRGYFETNSAHSTDQNCYAFPLRKGAWAVRRHSPGCQEHESWTQDGAGWTRCFLNKDPDLGTACRAFGGIEEPSGGFVFREAEMAAKAAALLGVTLETGNPQRSRETTLKQHKDGRLIAEVMKSNNDQGNEMQGWLAKGNKPWTKIFNTQVAAPIEQETINYDDICRHLVTQVGEDYGWMLKSEGQWRQEPFMHIKVALSSLGHTAKDLNLILGQGVFKCWQIVNMPFQPEYPGDRQWNRNAPQLRFSPTTSDNLSYPTWNRMLDHCGKGLDDAIKTNAWAKSNGILTGGEYLKCWIASIIQYPHEPLPYLFFHGPQNSGKSTFHFAIELLLTSGYKKADAALISQAGFNAELEDMVLCVVEETDLRVAKNKQAYNRIKDWVTSPVLLIHPKNRTPYHARNTTHWLQCDNDSKACPIFPGDTRIVITYVDELEPQDMIPPRKLFPMFEKEAPDFVAELLRLQIPESNDRLRVPVIVTHDKRMVQRQNQTPMQDFFEEFCSPCDGNLIKFSDLFDKFQDWCDPSEVHSWSKIRFGKELPTNYPKGRKRGLGQHFIGNIKWKDDEEAEPAKRLVFSEAGYLD